MARPSDNVDRYRRHQALAGAAFWAPTIVLYLIDEFGLARALTMQAIYYAAVVVLEVPSGWLSDRFGRVPTLQVVAVAWVAAHSLFLIGGPAPVIAGQLLLATGFAFLSGTDVTLHLESLEAEGRADEFEEREAGVRRTMLLVAAGSALVGGGLGVVDLRLPFAASLATAMAQFVVARRFADVADSDRDDHPRGFLADLVATGQNLRQPVLAWVALFTVGQVLAVHLVAELTPPFLTDAFGERPDTLAWSAMTTAVITAAVAGIAAAALRHVVPLARRVGFANALVCLSALPALTLAAMAAIPAIWVAPLLLLRRIPAAAASVLLPGVVAGHVGASQRATMLSTVSLGGRLAYTGALLTMSAVAGDDVARALVLATGITAVVFVIVAGTRLVVPGLPTEAGHGHDHRHEGLDHRHPHRHDDDHHGHHHAVPSEMHDHPHTHHPQRHRHRHTSDRHHGHDHR